MIHLDNPITQVILKKIIKNGRFSCLKLMTTGYNLNNLAIMQFWYMKDLLYHYKKDLKGDGTFMKLLNQMESGSGDALRSKDYEKLIIIKIPL